MHLQFGDMRWLKEQNDNKLNTQYDCQQDLGEIN